MKRIIPGLACTVVFFLLSCTGKETKIPYLWNLSWQLKQNSLESNDLQVLGNLPGGIALSGEKITGPGVFLYLETDRSGKGLQEWGNLKIAELEKMLALYRQIPWWMEPAFPAKESGIPLETQFLLWRRTDGLVGLLLPLIDQGYRINLAGDSAGFTIMADNNCPESEAGLKLRGVYLALGTDPYALIDDAFARVVKEMGLGKRRAEKQVPRWVESLGWCTWNACYHNVDHEKVIAGLRSFAKGGVRPGFVILDDGWQEARQYGFLKEETYLTGIRENKKKFPAGLSKTVKEAKEGYGVKDFLVWQTFQGYWRGIDPESRQLKKYSTYSSTGRSNRPLNKETAEWIPFQYNTIRPESISAFYSDYHSWLAGIGVTGVKVDNQSNLEFMTYGLGPRTKVMADYRKALEESVDHYFGTASVINCMALGSDVLFQASSSTVTRNSNDFFPEIPESHTKHLVTNAYNSLMTSQLVHPDWDMFQSKHEMGAFHASARAISGSPVYVSDKIGEHDFDLLSRVALKDGRVLRCPDPALPTPDILFRNPLAENVLLKMSNRNEAQGTYVLGAWNCRYEKGRAIEVSDTISLSMIRGVKQDKNYAVYSFKTGELRLRKVSGAWPLRLKNGEFEIYTVSLLDRTVAPLGALKMYNSSGIFSRAGWLDQSTYIAVLKGGAEIGFYSSQKPERVMVGDTPKPVSYDETAKMLRVTADFEGEGEVRLIY